MYQRAERSRAGSYDLRGHMIPRMGTLRRVPGRYRRILPLALMKRYQCIVIGGEAGQLTVAMTREENAALCKMLSQLTGRAIFPVLIEPALMNLLLKRIERSEQQKHKALNSRYRNYPLQIRSMLLFLTLPSRSAS